MDAKWRPKGTKMKVYEGPGTRSGRPTGSQGFQNDATRRLQASKMEKKWIPNRLELELRGRRVGEFQFRLFL